MTAPMYSASHRSGSWLTVWTPERVAEAPDPIDGLVHYTQQTLGVPWPTMTDLRAFRRQVREFFQRYPRADFFTLCRLVQWNRSRNRKFSRLVYVIDTHRDAWAQGRLPELDPPRYDDDVEERIRQALTVETDSSWRRRLIGAAGRDTRRELVSEWTACRGQQQLIS